MSKTATDKKNANAEHEQTNVLIVDQDPEAARCLLEILARRGIGARLATCRRTALDILGKGRCDLAFVASSAGETSNRDDGFDTLRAIRTAAPEMPTVMVAVPPDNDVWSGAKRTATDDRDPLRRSAELSVRAMRSGCCDFLLKPLDPDHVDRLIETVLPNRRVATAAFAREGDRSLYHIVGHSPKLIQTVALAEKIAPTSVPVLVSGESGTGKELISLLIHHKSRRALGPFVRVNCAALSDTLLESELFGHEKGAFTGAHVQRKGRFEMAHGGTLMLDEITETPPKFQAKLLRILEQQEFERVGGNESVRVNVRIISTTNRDLKREIQMGRFREDLYYRLSTARVVAAPLRERPEDLVDLVWLFVNQCAHQVQRRITDLDPTMMDIFAKYDWPGNVRQLRNVVLTSLILGVGPTLSLADVSWLFDELQPLTQHSVHPRGSEPIVNQSSFDPVAPAQVPIGGIPLADLERRAILETLDQTSGNQTQAARVLGISDRTLREKVRRYRRQERLEPVS